MSTLNLLSAGAAKGLALALQERFTAQTGAVIEGRYGAVGAMQEALFAAAGQGTPVDVLLVTQSMVDALIKKGHLLASPQACLGRVYTGIAVKQGEPVPDVADADALKAALLAASGVYFPDPARATAGIHFAKVLQSLGVAKVLSRRLHTFPNGASAMAALAANPEAGGIGCTQVTEINYTAGVRLVAALPTAFELATEYTAAVCARSLQPQLAAQFVALLCSDEAAGLRQAGGFVSGAS